MENLMIRPAVSKDVALIVKLDHSYHTDHVWQMEHKQSPGQINTLFKEIRLPRSMRVEYPREYSQLNKLWKNYTLLYVAEFEGEIAGYICVNRIDGLKLAWILDIVIFRKYRRQKIGTELINAFYTWAEENGYLRVMIEMQSKNYPGIKFAQSLGFEFCGYNDKQYDNQDITLYFSKRI